MSECLDLEELLFRYFFSFDARKYFLGYSVTVGRNLPKEKTYLLLGKTNFADDFVSRHVLIMALQRSH